jgi:hypothetical protein
MSVVRLMGIPFVKPETLQLGYCTKRCVCGRPPALVRSPQSYPKMGTYFPDRSDDLRFA